jgi:glyoxylase-like metal-dependent hydrolase (beta-lactamase superfamily II)
MNTLAAGLSFLDLRFQDHSHIIASAVLQSSAGVAILDPGPSTTLPTLRRTLEAAGITLQDVTTVLLTHVHLDHAGVTGTLAAENPRLRVYVHESGAPHMVAPEKLMASATRLYGGAMDRLWGEFRPVPREAIVTLAGGERIHAGGRSLDVAYTPGHASHHVSYFDVDSGIAFVGDTAGIRMPDAPGQPPSFVLPPTPPPDIDLEAWRESLARIEGWRPGTLFVTHFGPAAPSDAHLTEMREHLDLVGSLAKMSLAHAGTDEAREAWFSEEVRRELRRRVGEEARTYELAGRFDLNWRGLARYWRKRAG